MAEHLGVLSKRSTEKERQVKKTWGDRSPRKAEEKMCPKAGVINNCYILWREREKKDTGSKIPSDLAKRKSLISVKKIVSGELWEQKTDSQKGSQMKTRQSSQIRECCSFIQL